MYAEIFGLARVIAHGLEVQSERRVYDSPHHEAGDDHKAEAIVVKWPRQELDLVVAREFQPEDVHARHAHAAVAAGQVVELEQEGVEQHAEGESQHAEKNADIAHAQRADRQCNRTRCEHDREQHQLEGFHPQHARQDRRAVSANAQKHGMPERQQSGIAEKQVEPEQGDGVAVEGDHQAGVIGRHCQRQQGERSCTASSDDRRGRELHASVLPNNPAGRKISTATTIR